MMFRSKHFALVLGYDISTDLPFGFTLALGRRERRIERGCSLYRFMVSFHFDWPKAVWRDEVWRLSEPDTVKGLPIPRAGVASSGWTGRRFSLYALSWPRCFYVVRMA